MNDTFYNMINKDSFIGQYLEYCKNLETNKDFDFWGAIWCISIIVNRRLIIPRPNAPLFPNFYIALIAESGIARKSTAVGFANKILTNILTNSDNEIHLISSKMTNAKFIQTLNEFTREFNCSIIGLNIEEFVTMYKNADLIETLTDLYDNPTERTGYGTLSNGNINIRNVFISSLSGSTPNYYLKVVSDEEIAGGFSSRNIVIPANGAKRKIPWTEHDKTIVSIIQEGQKINKFVKESDKRQFEISNGAIQRYSNWYLRRKQSKDLYTRTFESREQDHVLKLAGLLAINSYRFTIEEEDIQIAIKIITKVKKKASAFFNYEIKQDDTDQLQVLMDKIRNYIYASGENGIKYRDLFMHVHNSCSKEDLEYILNLFHELDMIEKLQPYRSKTVIYRGGKNLFNCNTKQLLAKFRN